MKEFVTNSEEKTFAEVPLSVAKIIFPTRIYRLDTDDGFLQLWPTSYMHYSVDDEQWHFFKKELENSGYREIKCDFWRDVLSDIELVDEGKVTKLCGVPEKCRA